MKKIVSIFIIIIIAISNINAQRANAIYVVLQPIDNGVGLRGDYHISKLGLYSSLSYGNGALYKTYDLKNHFKVSTGILIPLHDSYGTIFDITAGVNYHYLESVIDNIKVNPVIFNTWSYELGISAKYSRFTIGLRTDILRWEPSIDIGIPIFKK